VHVFAGIQATSQVQDMKKGRLHLSFLRQVIQNQAFLVTTLTDFERNVTAIMSAMMGLFVLCLAIGFTWFTKFFGTKN